MGKSTPYDIAIIDSTLPSDGPLATLSVTKLDAVGASPCLCLRTRMFRSTQEGYNSVSLERCSEDVDVFYGEEKIRRREVEDGAKFTIGQQKFVVHYGQWLAVGAMPDRGHNAGAQLKQSVAKHQRVRSDLVIATSLRMPRRVGHAEFARMSIRMGTLCAR
jgi:hypothetical protein